MRPALFQVLCEIKEKTGTVKTIISAAEFDQLNIYNNTLCEP